MPDAGLVMAENARRWPCHARRWPCHGREWPALTLSWPCHGRRWPCHGLAMPDALPMSWPCQELAAALSYRAGLVTALSRPCHGLVRTPQLMALEDNPGTFSSKLDLFCIAMFLTCYVTPRRKPHANGCPEDRVGLVIEPPGLVCWHWKICSDIFSPKWIFIAYH